MGEKANGGRESEVGQSPGHPVDETGDDKSWDGFVTMMTIVAGPVDEAGEQVDDKSFDGFEFDDNCDHEDIYILAQTFKWISHLSESIMTVNMEMITFVIIITVITIVFNVITIVFNVITVVFSSGSSSFIGLRSQQIQTMCSLTRPLLR